MLPPCCEGFSQIVPADDGFLEEACCTLFDLLHVEVLFGSYKRFCVYLHFGLILLFPLTTRLLACAHTVIKLLDMPQLVLLISYLFYSTAPLFDFHHRYDTLLTWFVFEEKL